MIHGSMTSNLVAQISLNSTEMASEGHYEHNFRAEEFYLKS